MTALAERALRFMAEDVAEDPRLGGPMAYSLVVHSILLLLLLLWKSQPHAEALRVLEINVPGVEDVAVRGTGQDPVRGPHPDEQLAASPAKDPKPVRRGNTPKVTQSVAAAPQEKPAPEPPARLSARGPVFGSQTASSGAGIGREKIYLASSAMGAASGAKRPAAAGGEGLVGVPKGAIDLKADRGGGEAPGAAGGFLSSGRGSTEGESVLERRGESILADSPLISEATLVQKQAKAAPVLPAPDDGFFSIRGPLSRRKILSMKLPRYPRWAEESGVEALISMRINVTPNGRVKSDVLVEQTSGFPEFDQVALDAVKAILFAPLAKKEPQREEWGVATFNFRLQKARRKI